MWYIKAIALCMFVLVNGQMDHRPIQNGQNQGNGFQKSQQQGGLNQGNGIKKPPQSQQQGGSRRPQNQSGRPQQNPQERQFGFRQQQERFGFQRQASNLPQQQLQPLGAQQLQLKIIEEPPSVKRPSSPPGISQGNLGSPQQQGRPQRPQRPQRPRGSNNQQTPFGSLNQPGFGGLNQQQPSLLRQPESFPNLQQQTNGFGLQSFGFEQRSQLQNQPRQQNKPVGDQGQRRNQGQFGNANKPFDQRQPTQRFDGGFRGQQSNRQGGSQQQRSNAGFKNAKNPQQFGFQQTSPPLFTTLPPSPPSQRPPAFAQQTQPIQITTQSPPAQQPLQDPPAPIQNQPEPPPVQNQAPQIQPVPQAPQEQPPVPPPQDPVPQQQPQPEAVPVPAQEQQAPAQAAPETVLTDAQPPAPIAPQEAAPQQPAVIPQDPSAVPAPAPIAPPAPPSPPGPAEPQQTTVVKRDAPEIVDASASIRIEGELNPQHERERILSKVNVTGHKPAADEFLRMLKNLSDSQQLEPISDDQNQILKSLMNAELDLAVGNWILNEEVAGEIALTFGISRQSAPKTMLLTPADVDDMEIAGNNPTSSKKFRVQLKELIWRKIDQQYRITSDLLADLSDALLGLLSGNGVIRERFAEDIAAYFYRADKRKIVLF